MVRFFVDASLFDGDMIILDEENAAHAKVLRIKEGETVLLCDGMANEAVCAVDSAQAGEYRLRCLERRPCSSEPRVFASIYMAMPKADKLEHVIQKATELGAGEIVTFMSQRCVSRPDEKSLQKKLERWNKIAASAAEQSGRGRIPRVMVLADYKAALKRARESDVAIVFYENEQANTLRQTLSAGNYQTISLISGPEGGFEESEIRMAVNEGLHICTLGKRILRCETAPLCALSAVMYDSGEF